jgi:predicted membrane protein
LFKIKNKDMNATTVTFDAHDTDYLSTSAFFGEVRKSINSKDFKGGKVSNLFGETILDFTNADISGVVMLDISQAFGEVNITVPPNWHVETDLSQFLATTRDKRTSEPEANKADKILVLIGNCAFAAVQVYTSR